MIVLSTVACFLGLPGAGTLVLQFGEANPILIALASLAMLLLLAIPLVHEDQKGTEHTRGRPRAGGAAGLEARSLIKGAAAGGPRPPSGRTCGRSPVRRR